MLLPPSRREVLCRASLGATIAAVFSHDLARATDVRTPRILLRSSWQTVNIGDIGHTPGVIRLLGEHLPGAQITLWPANIGNGVEDLLRRNFPKLQLAQSAEEVRKAFADSDFLLHGSGPSLVAEKQLAQWRKETAKPYGVYGITLSSISDSSRAILDNAAFIFFRDSVSLAFAKEQKLKCPIVEFGPDGAFAVNVRNDEKADAFLHEHGLEKGKFLCVIPRLRYTPYWKIRNKAMTAEDTRRSAVNDELAEHDHAPLREAIIAVIRKTDMKVLVCPEDQSQMEVGKKMLVDPMPDEVKKRVVWREKYWLTDEALSTYVRSAGLFGLEMHSPIMCIGNGVPAIVCRFKEQTSKGLMWRDIGLGDWLFDMDQPADVKKIVPAVLAMAQDPAAAQANVLAAQDFVHKRQSETMAIVQRQFISSPPSGR